MDGATTAQFQNKPRFMIVLVQLLGWAECGGLTGQWVNGACACFSPYLNSELNCSSGCSGCEYGIMGHEGC